jgi:hypothetical protein
MKTSPCSSFMPTQYVIFARPLSHYFARLLFDGKADNHALIAATV